MHVQIYNANCIQDYPFSFHVRTNVTGPREVVQSYIDSCNSKVFLVYDHYSQTSGCKHSGCTVVAFIASITPYIVVLSSEYKFATHQFYVAVTFALAFNVVVDSTCRNDLCVL